MLRSSDYGELVDLSRAALRCSDGGEVRNLLSRFLPAMYPDEFCRQ